MVNKKRQSRALGYFEGGVSGAAGENRTLDLSLTKGVLCQ